MKWIYLLLGSFSVFMIVVFFFFGSATNRAEGLKVSISAAIVNLGLFCAINWAQKQK